MVSMAYQVWRYAEMSKFGQGHSIRHVLHLAGLDTYQEHMGVQMELIRRYSSIRVRVDMGK